MVAELYPYQRCSFPLLYKVNYPFITVDITIIQCPSHTSIYYMLRVYKIANNVLLICLGFNLQVHDRAQVFVMCSSEDGHGRPKYVGTFERWSNQPLTLPNTKCRSNISLFVLVLEYRLYLFFCSFVLSFLNVKYASADFPPNLIYSVLLFL